MRTPPRAQPLHPPKPVRLAPLDLLGLGLLGIRTRKLRAALSALGISIGIATLVVVTGIPASSQRALMAQLTALGTNMLQVQPVPDQKPPVLIPETATDMVARIGPVTVASAVARDRELIGCSHTTARASATIASTSSGVGRTRVATVVTPDPPLRASGRPGPAWRR